jgi:F0F1-type ATP synthase assembly protein I
LRIPAKVLQSTPMKLALAVLVYVLIGVVLGAGILLTVAGKPWFLIAAVIAYVVAFGKIGCMTH